MLKVIRVFLFDCLLIFSVFTLATGGTFFIGPNVAELFRSNPKYHRLLLSALTLTLIVVIATIQFRSPLEKHSNVISWTTQLKLAPASWVWVIFSFITGMFTYSSYLRHHVFASGFDLAVFSQAIWNTWHGSFLYSSIKGGICLLGDHVSPLLAFLAPLYGLWEDPTVLLVFQAIVTASAIFPIYLIAELVLRDQKLALIFALLFALYLPLRNAVRFDFHIELVGIPLCLWAYLLVLKNRLKLASLCLFFILLTKETACAPVAVFGLYSWWFLKKRRFGILWFLSATGVFLFDVMLVAPYFAGSEYFYLGGNYLSWIEEGTIIFLKHLFQPSSFTYLKKIFLPLGFFSFLHPPSLLLTVPTLFQNLAARNILARSIFFQYTAFLTPYVFISAIHGFSKFLEWSRRQHWLGFNKLRLGGLYWLISWGLLLTGVSEFHVIREYQKQGNAHFDYVRRYLKTVSSDASVRTHELLAPHVANRKELHIYENNHPREGGSEKAKSADYVILDERFVDKPIDLHITKLRGDDYVLAHEHDGFYVLTKSGISHK